MPSGDGELGGWLSDTKREPARALLSRVADAVVVRRDDECFDRCGYRLLLAVGHSRQEVGAVGHDRPRNWPVVRVFGALGYTCDRREVWRARGKDRTWWLLWLWFRFGLRHCRGKSWISVFYVIVTTRLLWKCCLEIAFVSVTEAPRRANMLRTKLGPCLPDHTSTEYSMTIGPSCTYLTGGLSLRAVESICSFFIYCVRNTMDIKRIVPRWHEYGAHPNIKVPM